MKEQRGSIQSGDEDEREQIRGRNIPGQDRIGVDWSCVRTGSDIEVILYLVEVEICCIDLFGD